MNGLADGDDPQQISGTAARLPRTAAVLLTGGTGARLGGVDKAALAVDGRTMLDLGLAALAGAERTVVVGPVAPVTAPVDVPVDFVLEDPPSGGPAAGLLAGLDHLVATSDSPPEWIVVLAVDMPRVSAHTVARLHSAATSPDGAVHDGGVLVDAEGRTQLCAVVRRAALERVRPDGPATGLGFFRLLRDLTLVEVAAEGDESVDVDTWADLERVTAPPPDVPASDVGRTLGS